MPGMSSVPSIIDANSTRDPFKLLSDRTPSTAAVDTAPAPVITFAGDVADRLLNLLDLQDSDLAKITSAMNGDNDAIQQLKQIYDLLDKLAKAKAETLVWEGPGKIAGWPTDVGAALNATIALQGQMRAKGLVPDPSIYDAYAYVSSSGQNTSIAKTELSGKVIDYDPKSWRELGMDDDGQTAWYVMRVLGNSNAEWLRFPNGQLYHLESGSSSPPGYLAQLTPYIKDPTQASLQLFGEKFLVETKRLVDAGLPIVTYDAYQYSLNGKSGYTTSNQILSRSSTDFSGIADGTIVAVDKVYYLVSEGRGQKLAGPPVGILMGLSIGFEPQGDVRYQNAIVATLDLLQRQIGVTSGDLDMAMYSYGGGQVGYAKLPPVVVSADPKTLNPVAYPPGTLLQYTDASNKVSYYRVTGTGLAKVEDPAAIARTVKGSPPDLSSIDPGTVVKLDDGKLYWVTEDKKTIAADGAPLLRFMSPEQKAIWDGIQMTAALEQGGLSLPSSDKDTCRFLDMDGNIITAKLPAKVFSGPGAEPAGKEYAPGDVVKNLDGSTAWYIDAQGKAQQARPCFKIKNVPEDFDPSKYNPGDIVGTDRGNYYRITDDHKKVETSYPLQEFIGNPSAEQIDSLRGKLRDQMNAKGSEANTWMIKLQMAMGKQNVLITMITAIFSAISNAGQSVARAMA